MGTIIAGNEFTAGRLLPHHRAPQQATIVASVASGHAVCAYVVSQTEGDHFFVRGLSQPERAISSGHRELLAVCYYLEEKADFLADRFLYWLTDSENLITFLTKGTTKQPIQRDIQHVLWICHLHRIRIHPIHLKREDPRIQIADAGSKSFDTDTWGISDQDFDMLDQDYGPFSIDLFADQTSTRCARFYSFAPVRGCCGVDAFTHDWSGENAWICPPIALAVRTLKKIAQSRMTGVLVLPRWPTQRYWPLIHPKDSGWAPASPKCIVSSRASFLRSRSARVAQGGYAFPVDLHHHPKPQDAESTFGAVVPRGTRHTGGATHLTFFPYPYLCCVLSVSSTCSVCCVLSVRRNIEYLLPSGRSYSSAASRFCSHLEFLVVLGLGASASRRERKKQFPLGVQST